MTFIASVVAKDGVAIIADSLVTTSMYVLEMHSFNEYVRSKNTEDATAQISLDMNEISGLFTLKPSHTKDYEDKLFRYDEFTAITTAGNAQINDLHIREIVDNKVKLNAQNTNFLSMPLGEKIADFCTYLTNNIKDHLQKYTRIDSTIFIFTHFVAEDNKTIIYKIETNQASRGDLDNPEFVYVPVPSKEEELKVVSEGQNRIAEKILLGGFGTIYEIVPILVQKMATDFSITISADYTKEILDFCMTEEIMSEVNIIRLTELSLQQAVDLATLLMKIEMAFQKYTRNIPTVGGVIKVAIINRDGFKFVSGNEIKSDLV